MFFGDKQIFGIDFLGLKDGLEIADIYISGENVTKIDNAHYKFVNTLVESAKHAAKFKKLLEIDQSLPGSSLKERYNLIFNDEARFDYQTLDWGPPTDDFFAIVIPFGGCIYLCAHLNDKEQNISIKIVGEVLAHTMLEAAKHITNHSDR